MYGMEHGIRAIMKRREALFENQKNEVAWLRELLNRAEHSAKLWEMDALRYHRNEEYWKERAEKAEARLAPAPEEPTIKESLTVQPDWRELGPDEMICEGDEYYTGKWTKITGWLGYPASNFSKVRTRRPLPNSPESEGIKKQEDKCPHHSIVPLDQGEMVVHLCTRCGKKLKKYPKPQEEIPLEKEIERSLKLLDEDPYSLDTDEKFGEVVLCLRYLSDEIKKLKEK